MTFAFRTRDRYGGEHHLRSIGERVPGCHRVASFVSAVLALNLLFAAAVDAAAAPSYALAMHGEPALPPEFTHMPYADPAAPKGGRLVQGILGTFDSLNPLIVRFFILSSLSN